MTCRNCTNQTGMCGEPFQCPHSHGNPDEDYKECDYYDPWVYD